MRYDAFGLALGILGAGFLFHLARKALVSAWRGVAEAGAPARDGQSLTTGVIFSLANPAGLAFWTGMGGGILGTSGASPSVQTAAVFLIAFITGALAWGSAMAALVGWGRRFATPGVFRAIEGLCGLALGYFGVRLLWSTLQRYGRWLMVMARAMGRGWESDLALPPSANRRPTLAGEAGGFADCALQGCQVVVIVVAFAVDEEGRGSTDTAADTAHEIGLNLGLVDTVGARKKPFRRLGPDWPRRRPGRDSRARLMGKKRVVHRPERPLMASGFRGLRGCFGAGVTAGDGEVPVDEAKICARGLAQFLHDRFHAAAMWAFEIAVLDERHRGIFRAVSPIIRADRNGQGWR